LAQLRIQSSNLNTSTASILRAWDTVQQREELPRARRLASGHRGTADTRPNFLHFGPSLEKKSRLDPKKF
jgi:hypothetical protein